MKFHSVATLAIVASISLAGAAHAAPTTSVHTGVHAFFGKPSKVSLTLQNDGQQPLTLKAGTQEWTLQPGKTATVKLDNGDKIVAETASPDHAAGEVVAQATFTLNGATVHIK